MQVDLTVHSQQNASMVAKDMIRIKRAMLPAVEISKGKIQVALAPTEYIHSTEDRKVAYRKNDSKRRLIVKLYITANISCTKGTITS